MEKKKSKSLRKTLLLVTASVLTAAISVGVTLSYLTAKSNTKENTFTPSTSTISGKVKEPKFDADKNYYFSPGDVIPKNPMVENTSSEDSMFVGAKVRFYIKADGTNEVQVSYDNFVKYVKVFKGTEGTGDIGFNTEWTEMTGGTDSLAKYFMYTETKSGYAQGELPAGTNNETPAIFGSVKANENITIPDATTGYAVGKIVGTATGNQAAATNADFSTIAHDDATLKTFAFPGFEFRIKVDAFGVAKDSEVTTLAQAESYILAGLNNIA